MQPNYATAPEQKLIGNSTTGRAGIWLVLLFVALVAAAAWRVPSMRFEGGPVVNATQPTGTLRDASPRAEWRDLADLSVPRASDVRFAPAGDEEAPSTF